MPHYCNSLLLGLPAFSVHSLHRIQNCTSRLILKNHEPDPITPPFQSLHWLPISQRIQYKIMLSVINLTHSLLHCISVTVFKFIHPPILSTLHLSLSLQIPQTRLSTVGSWAFSVLSPSTGNDRPVPLWQKPLCQLIQIKSHFFPQKYLPAMFSVLCGFLIHLKSVCCPF